MREDGHPRHRLQKGMIPLVLLLAAAGCGEELGPEPMPTARVSGVVRVGKTAVGGGWVEFLPVDGTIGLLASARLRPDGSFVAERVPVGRVAIRLVHPPFPIPCQRILEHAYVIRRDILPDPSPHLDIELNFEAKRHCQ